MRLSINEWTVTLDGGISGRELRRAVEARVLPAMARGKGRGHGAVVIESAAMLTYLETREQMMEGTMPKADWFFDVIRGGGRDAA